MLGYPIVDHPIVDYPKAEYPIVGYHAAGNLIEAVGFPMTEYCMREHARRIY